MYSSLRSKNLYPHYKLHLMMQIIFQNLIIGWQPYPSWKQRAWSSHWCCALRALLSGLILAEMDAVSAVAGKDFCRSCCTLTEPVCQQSPKWGWQLCVPGHVALQKRVCCGFLGPGRGVGGPSPPCPDPLLIHCLSWGFHRPSSSFQPGLYRCKPSPDVVSMHSPCKHLSLIQLTGIGDIESNSFLQIYPPAPRKRAPCQRALSAHTQLDLELQPMRTGE